MKIFVVILFFLPILAWSTTLKVALYDNHEEYLKYSKAYKLNWMIFKQATEKLDITIQAQPYVWLRALRFIEEQEIDVLIGAYYTKQRQKFAHFSLPISTDYVYLYVNHQSLMSKPINYEKDIIGVTKKSIGDDLANLLGFSHIYRKSASEQVFRLLRKDRLDYAIFSESVAEKHCQTMSKRNQHEHCVFAKKPALLTNSFHTIYSRTPTNISIAHQIDAIIEKMIKNNQLKALHLEAGYSKEDYEIWLRQKQQWLENLNN